MAEQRIEMSRLLRQKMARGRYAHCHKTVAKNCSNNKDNWPFVSEHILTHGSLHYASTPTLTGMDTTAITVTPAGGTSTFRPQMPASHYHQNLQVSTLTNFFQLKMVIWLRTLKIRRFRSDKESLKLRRRTVVSYLKN